MQRRPKRLRVARVKKKVTQDRNNEEAHGGTGKQTQKAAESREGTRNAHHQAHGKVPRARQDPDPPSSLSSVSPDPGWLLSAFLCDVPY